VIGHRGSRTTAIENTLAAIDLAADAGADGVEIDVRTCASDDLVVMHDTTLTRLTSGRDTREISALTAAELGQIELGEPPHSAGAAIATLPQVLALCNRRQLALDVELKRDVPDRLALVRRTASTLRQAHPLAPLWVSSFDPLMLAAFRALAPRIDVALLLQHDGPPAGWLRAPLGAVAVHPERTMTRPAALAAWHGEGRTVVPWTVNEPIEIIDLVRLGVDGIISDDPQGARRVLKQLGYPAAAADHLG